MARVPLASPLPYVIENAWVRLLYVEELEVSNVSMPWQFCVQELSASQRSAEPVSKMTLYATGGVPTAIEP